MKRFGVGALGTVIVLAAVAYLFRTQITLRLMDRFVAANLQTDLLRELPDGLHVALCGAGSPLPDPARSGPCAAVIAGRLADNPPTCACSAGSMVCADPRRRRYWNGLA